MDGLRGEDLHLDAAAAAVGVSGVEVVHVPEHGLVGGGGQVAVVDTVTLEAEGRAVRDPELEERGRDQCVVGQQADVGCDRVELEDGVDKLAAFVFRTEIHPVGENLRLYQV